MGSSTNSRADGADVVTCRIMMELPTVLWLGSLLFELLWFWLPPKDGNLGKSTLPWPSAKVPNRRTSPSTWSFPNTTNQLDLKVKMLCLK